MNNLEPISSLLKQDAILFWSGYGRKAVTETWTVRLNKQIKNLDQVKDYTNINIATGRDSLITDVDLDCPEANKLADYFLPRTELEFGRASTPRAHRLFKVIDLNKNHTRSFFSFDDKVKSMLVEIRANKHYTMCWGQYDNEEKVVWSKTGNATEVSWEQLNKACALLSVASVLLKRFPDKNHDDYIRYAINAMWQNNVEESDCFKIIEAVLLNSGCGNCCINGVPATDKIGKVANTYSKDKSEQRSGLPTLADEFYWSEDQVKDFKKLLFKITGRSALPEATHNFVNQIVYMMKQKKFYDLQDKEMYDQEAIDMKYAREFHASKYTPLKHWKLHPDRKVCVDFTYKPDQDKRIITIDKKMMINVYEKPDIQPDSKVDTDVFWDLTKRVIPHDECRKHFVDWIAYQVQNPGKKIRHAIILQSSQFQIGKGSLFDLYRMIVGKHNSRKIELAEALDKGKGFLINAQTVLIDEAKSSGSWSEKAMLINTLKTMISEGTVGTRQLYREYNEQETCTNYWINTNYEDAFNLPPKEVRYWVYFSPATQDLNLLNAFHTARLEDNLAGGVLAELLDRDISDFKPLAPAPWTQYRDQMSKLADKPLHEYVKDQFDQGRHPFDRDMVTVPELFEYLREQKKMKVTRERDVADALEKIGGVKKKGCVVRDVGQNVTVWTIRNHNDYENLTATELGRKYQPFYSERS